MRVVPAKGIVQGPDFNDVEAALLRADEGGVQTLRLEIEDQSMKGLAKAFKTHKFVLDLGPVGDNNRLIEIGVHHYKVLYADAWSGKMEKFFRQERA